MHEGGASIWHIGGVLYVARAALQLNVPEEGALASASKGWKLCLDMSRYPVSFLTRTRPNWAGFS